MEAATPAAYPLQGDVALLEPCNHLMGDPDALARDWEAHGAQLFREVIDPGLVATARGELEHVLGMLGVLEGEPPRYSGYVREAGFADGALYETPSYRSLLSGPDAVRLLDTLFGGPVTVTGQSQVRYALPGDRIHDQPPHQDGPYLRVAGARTCWMPLVDISPEMGGLAVLVGSHLHGPQPHVDCERLSVVVPGRKLQRVPADLMRGEWRTADFRPGDCLVFHANTIHAALPNVSSRVRLSVDSRVQPADAPVSLKQRFSRLEIEAYRRDIVALGETVPVPFAEADRLAEEMMMRDLPPTLESLLQVRAERAGG